MRHTLLLIFGLSLVGCAAHQEPVPMRSTSAYYDAAPASALVFDPPMLAYAPIPWLSREGRSPSAFYGYEQPSVDVFEVYQRDTQRGDAYPDYFDRTARSLRSTTTYR